MYICTLLEFYPCIVGVKEYTRVSIADTTPLKQLKASGLDGEGVLISRGSFVENEF